MGSSLIFSLLIIACVLALVLVFLASKRINEEGLTVTDESKKHFKRSVEDVYRQQQQEQALMSFSGDSSAVSNMYINKYAFGKSVKMSVEEALEALKNALKADGFQILSEADVMSALKKKKMPNYRMLTVYHEALAGRAVDMEPSIGLLLSNAMIRRDLSEVVHVEFSDPSLLLGSSTDAALLEITAKLKVKLQQVLQQL